MTQQLAIEIKTHLERSLSALLQATALTPMPEQLAIREAYAKTHATYTGFCDRHGITWRDAATSARIVTG
jgi:hypothetical protein